MAVNDDLIKDDNGNNRFLWFAKWNQKKYYPTATDLTSTTIKLGSNKVSSLEDKDGGTVVPAWDAITDTLPIGEQIGRLSGSIYEKVRKEIKLDAEKVAYGELELYGVSATDVLIRV